jgi:hypothetical protein
MKSIPLSILLLAAASAFANEAADEQRNRLSFRGELARPEVRADYLKARADGTLPVTSEAASAAVLAVVTARRARPRVGV